MGHGGDLGELAVCLLWGQRGIGFIIYSSSALFCLCNGSQFYNKTTIVHSPEGSQETF